MNDPITLRSGLVLAHRLAKAATSEGLARRGDPTPELEHLYDTWSRGGAALIVTGNTTISRRHRERMGNVVLDARTDRAALARLAAAAKRAGNAALVQLCHPGRQTSRFVANDPVAPSAGPAVAMLGAFARPRALREEEIAAIRDAFVTGAEMARDAGFDGVQLHAAHGFLLSQFLSARINRREDAWGGTIEGRARLLIELVERTRAACGARFTIAVKLDAPDPERGHLTHADALAVIALLERAGIDLLEISGGDVERARMLGLGDGDDTPREGYFADVAQAAKRVTGAAVMATGGWRSRAAIDAAIARGAIDLAGMARPLCVEPDLPRRLLRGEADRAALHERPKAPGDLAAAGETGYFAWRLGALARGTQPRHDISPIHAALDYVATDAVLGARRALFGE
ncbi:NADH:flavin oxidoreductase [Sandaracinus amylolyticus]|nr:NADH:flavin oxidoreductase [Sandaracinus amylolyticus]